MERATVAGRYGRGGPRSKRWAIMFGRMRTSRRLVAAAVLAVAAGVGLVVDGLWPAPAQAQWFGERPYVAHRPRSGGFFQEMFGPYQPREREYEQRRAPRVDHTRPPPPPKAAKAANATTIVVMGDDMADWLAYGLEDAFSDAPDMAVVRKDKLHSGLLRYDAKSDLDWWHVARDLLTQEKANYVVMMLGLHDRENIRESDLAKEAEKQQAEKQAQADKQAAEKKQDSKANDKNGDKTAQDKKDQADKQKTAAEAEKPKPKPPNGVIEFRTDRWAAVYSKRIDETIAALKSKGVPVFWVGLPSIRGPKATADASYLNDLYRARAERAGVVFIDVWDGFVDDAGKFSSFGPDYEGQMRRLRSSDGVFFTSYGARKLAHYVEREIHRYMSNRSLQVALPTGPVAVPNGKSAARPEVGPVVPLTVTTGTSDELLGGAGSKPAHGDAVASRVLVNGEPVSAPHGRADDFAWPPGSDANRPAPPAGQGQKPAADRQSSLAPAAAPAAASGKRPIRIITPGQPDPAAAKTESKPAPADGKAEQTAQDANAPKAPAEVKPQPTHASPPPHRRRPAFQFPNPFGWLR
jgi:hypothetical protein